MFRSGLCLALVALAGIGIARSDEPTVGKNPVKQRVSPKVLKEAMALPEYKVRTATPKVSSDDLKKLADKLKANGANEDAELLHRFVLEHERLTNELSRAAESHQQAFDIHCDVIEVNSADLPGHSTPAHCSNPAVIREFEATLRRLVTEKKAKALVEPALIATRTRPSSRDRVTEDPMPPESPADAPHIIKIGENASLELSAVPISKDQVRIQLTSEVSGNDREDAVTILGSSAPAIFKTAPGIFKHRLQSTIEANIGETVIQASPATSKGMRQFVLIKVTNKN